jgi:hypothetical protein
VASLQLRERGSATTAGDCRPQGVGGHALGTRDGTAVTIERGWTR